LARTIEKLSALAVSRAKEPGYYSDGGGLYLQVSRSGTKSWIFRYTLNKKSREMGLGSLHTITLAQAREQARSCRAALLEGVDPLETRNAAKLGLALERAKTVTFDDCAAQYIAAHRSSWKREQHALHWERSITNHASAIIGDIPVSAIDTALIVKVLQPIWGTKTETASKLRGRIESILDWATVSHFRSGENPARWKGHLDHLLADPGKVARVTHYAALPWQEVGEFMASLRQCRGVAARALEFGILTAARSGEVRGARWEEIDLDAAIWTVPAERMKAGREHRVPLSTAAIALLKSMPRVEDLVFPGMKKNVGLSDMTITAVLKRMGRGDITVHGFRSTFRDWCAESAANSFPREVCEHALAHRIPDKVEAAYRRGDLIEKRKVLMQVWADYCAKIPASAEVTAIRLTGSA
jgi:integrase